MRKRRNIFLLAGLLFCFTNVFCQKKKIISIIPDTTWKTLVPAAYGVNTQTAAGPSWNDKTFLEMINQLKPGNMRYPGGTIGNYTDWRTGQFMYSDVRDPNKGPVYGTYKGKDHRKIKINTYRPEELKRAIDVNGATPIYMVNMLTDTLGSTLEMLAHCEKIGLPVKYIELGNELYLTYFAGGSIENNIPGDYASPYHFPTAKSYADECNKWIKAIKKRYPQAEIAYQVVFGRDWEKWHINSPRSVEWNQTMFDNIRGTDRVSIHHYAKIFKQTNALDGLWYSMYEFLSCFEFIQTTLKDKKVWFTEYNNKDGNINGDPNKSENPWGGRWIHGINTAMITCMMLDLPQVELTCIHNLAANLAAALITYNNLTIPPCPEDEMGASIKKLEFTAAGVTHVILGNALNRASKMQMLSFSNNPEIKVTNGVLMSVYGTAFDDNGAKRLLLFNISDRSQHIDLNNYYQLSSVESYYMDSLTEPVTGINSVSHKKSTVNKGSITLLPFSVSIVM